MPGVPPGSCRRPLQTGIETNESTRSAPGRRRDLRVGRRSRRRPAPRGGGRGCGRILLPQLQGRPRPQRARRTGQGVPARARNRPGRHGDRQLRPRLPARGRRGLDRVPRRRAVLGRVRAAGAAAGRMAGEAAAGTFRPHGDGPRFGRTHRGHLARGAGGPRPGAGKGRGAGNRSRRWSRILLGAAAVRSRVRGGRLDRSCRAGGVSPRSRGGEGRAAVGTVRGHRKTSRKRPLGRLHRLGGGLDPCPGAGADGPRRLRGPRSAWPAAASSKPR